MDGPELSFGEQLRLLRRERGLSLRKFEQTAHHSRSLVSEWETGRKIPAPEVVERLDHLLAAGGKLSAAAAMFTPTISDTHIASEIVRRYSHQGPVAPEIRRRAIDAKQLDVLAVRGLGILGLNDSLLRPALIARTEVLQARVLLLDPDSDAVAKRAAEIGESTSSFAAGIRLAIARLEEVAADGVKIDLEVRLYSCLPVWRIIRLDDLKWVSSFGATWEGHESTIYEIPYTPRGSFWTGYRRQFEDMHANARRVI